MRALFIAISTFLFTAVLKGQTLAGQATYNFLKLPAGPQLSALAGVNVSTISDDITLAFDNPSLLRPQMHGQFAANFNNIYAGIRNYQAMAGYYISKPEVTVALGVHFMDYGTLAQTDAAGNVLGSFRPGDYVIQASASKQYLQHWYYGLALKYIQSNYGFYRSGAIAIDAGVSYIDTLRKLQVSLVMKNMGAQLKTYSGMGEDLPFDLQLGVTQRLANAPLQFSLTAHHLHQYNILYNDTVFNRANDYNPRSNATIQNIFRHFVLAVQGFIGERVEVTAGYNYLRRAELSIPNTPNGLTGFSLGAGVLFPKLQIRYARSYYQSSTAYNQFGLNLSLHDYFGLGHFGERIGW